jgi:hypothetical protein
VAELIDELAAEKLPAALMDPILTERLADVAHGQYTTDAWPLQDKIRTRHKTLADASSNQDAR